MDRRRAAGALLALAACVACSSAAPTASNQTALELLEGPTEGCYYNFQHYGEGDRIMTNEPCLNCTCHNRMLMCYLKVCPFTKPIGQDCTIEKRADQCCPIVTCPDVPVDLLTTSSTSSPAEYGATGLGKVDKYGCSINGKYFPEGSKVPPTPNKPCEHCYCIRNMTTCVMQECTLHVDGCTPIYHKDVCCPVRYSCDHQEDEMLLLDDMTTTVRPTPGFLLTTTTAAVTQVTQDCVHDDQIFADGALIKTEKACEHCYCMKGDIVCVVQECGTPMENEGKNCTSLPPRQGQCCPDTYICEGDEIISDLTTGTTYEDLTTLSPPRRAEGSGYRNEPDEPYTEMSTFEGSGEEQATTLDTSDIYTSQKQTPEIIDEIFAATEESLKPSLSTIEPDKGQNTVPDDSEETTPSVYLENKTTQVQEAVTATQASVTEGTKETVTTDQKATVSDYHHSTEAESTISLDDELIMTTESGHETKIEDTKITEAKPEIEKEITSTSFDDVPEITTSHVYAEPSSSESSTLYNQDDKYTTLQSSDTYEPHELPVSKVTTTEIPKEDNGEDEINKDKQEYDSTIASTAKEDKETTATFTTVKSETLETTSVNPVENEIDEDAPPPGRIPGEGDCLLNGITYKNNTNVPNINNCHSSCICLSSIVKCNPIICSPPPENINNMNDCQPIYDTPDACCPTYVCHSRETMPPESHNQMSGTESPKLPSEKPESQCHGDECQSHGTVPELCNSEDCQTQEQEKDSDNSPPLIHPEPCSGDNCLNVEQTCIGEMCHQQTPAEHICNSENGCQPSEAEPCEGHNCGSGVLLPVDAKPICHDSEECKAGDTSETPKQPCIGDSNCDSTVVNKNTIETECTEENCRRKDQSQDEQPSPLECKGSDCERPHKDGTNDFTTETSVKSESSEEPTTDKIITDFSETPDHIEPATDRETQKVTPVDIVTTEKHDGFEHSTEMYSDLTTLEFEKGAPTQESFTEPAETHTTKLESSDTKTNNEPELEKGHTVVPDLHMTVSEEQATQPIEQITKDISTESPLTIPNIEHSTELPTENTITTERYTEPTKPLDTSTETSYIESQDKDKEHEEHELHTETPEIFVTASKAPDSEETVSEDYTKEQKIITKSPEPHTTYLESESQEDNKVPESDVGAAITESSITTTNSEVTLKHKDYTVKEDDTMKTVINEITEIPELTPDKSILVDQSSQSTKLEEPVTTQSYSDTHMEEIPVENPKIDADNPPLETTSHEIPIHTSTEAVDIGVEYSQSPSSDGTMSNTVSDKEIDFTTPVETQEYVTSSDNLQDHATKSSVTEQNLETQTQENLATEEGMTNLLQFEKESPTTVISQEFTFKESSTETPETITTKTVDEIKTPSSEDTYEVNTKKLEESYQEVTTQKLTTGTESENILETEQQESISELMPQTSVSEFETTMPADQSHKGQETTIKYTESVPSKKYSDETTLTPEIIVSTSDETTPLTEEVENETPEVLSTRRVGENTVVATTESIKKPETEESYKIPVSSEPATEPNLIEETTDKTTLIPEIQSSEKEKMPIPSGDHKTDETQSATKPDIDETEKQYPVEQDTSMPEDRVTERVNSDVNEDTEKEIYKPTEHSDSQETKAEDGFTSIPALITQSQESETKLVSEMQTEISTTPTDIIKDEKEHTESPMILVTETEEEQTIKSEDYAIHVKLDTTTQAPSKEYQEASTQEAPEEEPHKSTTQNSETTLYEKEYDANTPSSDYPKKEIIPEISSIPPFEYTTTIIEDTHKEDVTSSALAEDDKFVTETVEKLAPTTKLQEDTTTKPIHIISESEMHAPDVMPESTTTFTENEETPTKSPDIFAPEPTITYEQESDVKHTDYPHDNADVQLTTTKTVDETVTVDVTNDEGTLEHVTVITTPDVDEYEHTEMPKFSTTKYVETSDSVQDKITEEAKPSKEEVMYPTSAHDEYVTTERHIHTDRPINPEYHSTEILDQERSTNLPQTIDTEIKLSTPVYSSITTSKESELPEITLSTAGVLSTESLVIHEDDHRRTSAPSEENIQSEPSTTEKEEVPLTVHKTTEQPEAIKTQLIEDADSKPEIPTITPAKETVTLAPTSQEPATEHDNLLPQTTDDDLIPTGTIGYHEDHDASVTKNVEKDITEYTTEKQIYTEQGEIQEVQTDSPTKGVTAKVEEIEKTTASEDLIQVPIETIPERIPTVETVPQESETESVLQETDIEVSVPLETGTEESVSIETETKTVPKEKDTTITKDSETTVPKQTETSILFDSATETSLPKQTEIDSPVPTKTETTVTESPETSVSIITDTNVPEPIDTETEITVPKDTEIISSEVPESVLQVTKESQTVTPEHEIEPESTTYHKNLPEVISSTSQPIYSSSETTPYLVELQEHTNKVDEDVSSVIPLDTYTTKSSEIYQTERGDQPLETVTDKSTIISEEQSEKTITEKSEEVTPVPQEQHNEYPTSTSVQEGIPVKTETEQATEVASLPSESPVTTVSSTSSEEKIPAISTEEQSATPTPTISEASEDVKVTTVDFSIETSTGKKDLSPETERAPEQDTAQETTAIEEELLPAVTKATTIKAPIETTTQYSSVHDKVTKPEEKPFEPYSPTTAPEIPKPGAPEIQPTEEIPSPDFPPSGTSGYGQEPDYVEEDQAFGPGTCRYGGKVYVSAQQIPRDDPCDFCFCFRSDIICLQQSCPPPIQGCHEEPIQGFCCPRYECPVSMATTLNVTTTTTTTTTTLPPHFLPHAYKGAAQRRGCQIKGHTYKVGDVVRASSGPCLQCTCGGDGQMKCDPKACTPEPMLRQMIAAAVSAKRRR